MRSFLLLCLLTCVSLLLGQETSDYIAIQQRIADYAAAGKTLEASRAQRELSVAYLYELNDSDKAISQLLKTISTLEGLKDSVYAMRAREDLARVYAVHRYYNEALYHLEILEKYYLAHKDFLRTGFIQNTIADCYVSMDSLQKATPYYENVEKIVEDFRQKDFQLDSLEATLAEMNIASLTALTRKGFAIAGLTDTSAVDFGGLIDKTTELYPLIVLNCGHRYIGKQDTSLAEYYYQRCTQEKNLDEVIHRDALFKLAEIYKARRHWDIAYSYLARYSVINDSLINDRRQRLVDRLLVQYQTHAQKNKIRDLEKDRKISEFQNRLQNVLTFSLLFGSIIVLFAAYFTIRNYQHRFNANQIIHNQNEEINRQRITELENNVKIQSMHSMIQGQEAERERVAKDLHDSLGGLLSTVKLHFDAIQSQAQDVAGLPEYNRAYTLLDEACREVRHISNNLQPGALHRLGLIPAVNDLINRARTVDSPFIEFKHHGVNGALDPRISLNVYRIVQELLNNALKHSGASEVSVAMTQTPKALSIVVQDNGKGYEPGNTRMGMGTENIASRVNYLKGDLSIHSVIGEGTTTQIEIPL